MTPQDQQASRRPWTVDWSDSVPAIKDANECNIIHAYGPGSPAVDDANAILIVQCVNGVVTDAMVEAALNAYHGEGVWIDSWKDEMRAALVAAMRSRA